jgi:hypothetical protein
MRAEKANCQIGLLLHKKNIRKFSSHLYSNSECLYRKTSLPQYAENAKRIQTAEWFYVIILMLFHKISWNINIWRCRTIGDVNQGLEGMQRKIWCFTRSWCWNKRSYNYRTRYRNGVKRFKTYSGNSIPWLSIVRYQIMSDDLATLQYRTVGKQKPH